MCDAIRLLDHPAWREAAQAVQSKPFGEPLAVVSGGGVTCLDPRGPALLEAASPESRADIAQSVEQRFRKP